MKEEYAVFKSINIARRLKRILEMDGLKPTIRQKNREFVVLLPKKAKVVA